MVLSRLSEVAGLTVPSQDDHAQGDGVSASVWAAPGIAPGRGAGPPLRAGNCLTQFLSLDDSSYPSAAGLASADFLCGPAKTQPTRSGCFQSAVLGLRSSGRGRGLPSSFATIHLRMQLPPGFNVDRVTQLPLWDEGQVQAGHATGRDIAISVEHDTHHFGANRLNKRAGLEIDEDAVRPLIRGDEWPAEVSKAPRAVKRVHEVAPAEKHDGSDAAARGSSSEGGLAARVAQLEAESKAREETLTAALAQAGDKMELPKGANASKCCSCDGVVTFAPAGRCYCPMGSAETRPAPGGCQAATDMFKGRSSCAGSCREIFWGKERAQKLEKVEAVAAAPVLTSAPGASRAKVAEEQLMAEAKTAEA